MNFLRSWLCLNNPCSWTIVRVHEQNKFMNSWTFINVWFVVQEYSWTREHVDERSWTFMNVYSFSFTNNYELFLNVHEQSIMKWKWNESGFRPPLCTYRLNWARRTSWGWWDDWDDTVLQTQDSKFEPWRSAAEHATSRSRRLPTILTVDHDHLTKYNIYSITMNIHV